MNFVITEEKSLSGKVLAVPDSTEIYHASAIGSYSVNNYKGNGPDSELYCELKSDGHSFCYRMLVPMLYFP